jgi:proteasome accessory factor B
VTGTDSAWFDDEVGYRIDRDAYALPPVQFDAEELAVLGLAEPGLAAGEPVRAGGERAAQAQRARAGAGREQPGRRRAAGPDGGAGVRRASTPPTRSRTPVQFSYRKPDGTVAERHVGAVGGVSAAAGPLVLAPGTATRLAPREFPASPGSSAASEQGSARAGSYRGVPGRLEARRASWSQPEAAAVGRARARLRVPLRPGRHAAAAGDAGRRAGAASRTAGTT